MPELHNEHVNYSRVGNPWKPDELQGAFGRFNMHVLVQGCASEKDGPMWVMLRWIGIYAKDSYDFTDEPNKNQYLGYWRENPPGVASTWAGRGYKKLSNRDYRDYRRNHNRGRDYEVFTSDTRLIGLTKAESPPFNIP